jgi:Ca2+ transporting ATPase
MQVFNEINCRKIQASDFNVFSNFFNNPMFFFILFVTIIVQILLVQFGGEAVKCTPLTVQ